jgi:hypothetical protein
MKRSPVAVIVLASLFLVPTAVAAELRVEIRQATPRGLGICWAR